jgi:hypothetical protein
MVRGLFIAALTCLAFTSANAQPTTATGDERPSGTLGATQSEHPEWFREPNVYKPCPAAVVFPGNRLACLGLPEYPHRTSITVYWHPRHWWRRGYFY